MANSKVDKNRNTVCGKKKGSPKTGGRQKGTPNKKTLEFSEALGSFNPVGALVEIYNQCEDWGIKLGAVKEMLKYIYPQRKAVDMNIATKDAPIIVDNIK